MGSPRYSSFCTVSLRALNFFPLYMYSPHVLHLKETCHVRLHQSISLHTTTTYKNNSVSAVYSYRQEQEHVHLHIARHLPHVKRGHQSNHILTIFREFQFRDFGWIKIRGIVFLEKQEKIVVIMIIAVTLFRSVNNNFSTVFTVSNQDYPVKGTTYNM